MHHTSHERNNVLNSVYVFKSTRKKTYTNARWSIKHLIQFFFYFTSSEICSSYFHIFFTSSVIPNFQGFPMAPLKRPQCWPMPYDQWTFEDIRREERSKPPKLCSKKRAVNLGKNSKIFIKIISVWGKKKHRTKNNIHMILVGLWEVLIQQSEVQEIEL